MFALSLSSSNIAATTTPIVSLDKDIIVSSENNENYIENHNKLLKEIKRLSDKYKISSSTVYEIIKCEGRLEEEAVNKNYNKKGDVWSIDKWDLQINDFFHKDEMKKLGLDYNNRWDALEYGFILMTKEGLKPWKASSSCWLDKIN